MLDERHDRNDSMKHFVLIALLCLAAGTAWSGTFELSDPANEMLEEEQAREEGQWTLSLPGSGAKGLKNALCTVDTETGSCSCIDQKHAKKLALTREECVAEVLRALQLN
jgi:hypothetical protein